MPNTEKSANIRIAKNTAFIYIRIIVTILVGVVTSRLVLQALGVDDYGLYNVVGSTVALFSFITVSLAATTQRFINVELGKPGGDPRRVFNVCHVIHIASAALLFLLTEAVGVVYIHHWLNVAPGKEADAMFVFQVSVAAACLGIANIPFQSMLAAFERFRDQALADIFFTLVKLALVVVLLFCRGNLIRIYAVFMAVGSVLSFAFYHGYCYRRWRSIVRWKFVRGWSAYREPLSFNNYNLLSAGANVVKWQGGHILLNYFFGTAVNAANGIANLVATYVERFTGNIATAAAPQIIQNHSGNNTDRARYLTKTVSRMSLLVNLMVFFTVMPDLEFLLGLWLGSGMPEGAAAFTRCTLILGLVSSTTAGLYQMINASGQIKWFKIQYAFLYFAALLLSFGIYRAGGVPVHTLLLVYIAADALSRALTLILCRSILHYPVREFMRSAYPRPALIAVLMCLFMLGYRRLPLSGTAAHLAGTALAFLTVTLLCFYIGLKKKERQHIQAILSRKSFHTLRKLRMCFTPARQLARDLARDGWKADLKHPKDINEKILWLISHRTSRGWGRYADKIAVREYLAHCGLQDLSVPLLGSWKRASEIDFAALPEKFVLKCNHDSGSTVVVDKAKGVDEAAVRASLDRALKKKFGYIGGERFYNEIPPRILAEPLLEPDPGAKSIPDYKVWCFDGVPKYIWACYDRTEEGVAVRLYDTAWVPQDEKVSLLGHWRDAGDRPAPRHLAQMLQAASRLSKGFPEVRVDFYEAGGKLYFGEMTFSSMGGRMEYYTPQFLRELGDYCKLPYEQD